VLTAPRFVPRLPLACPAGTSLTLWAIKSLLSTAFSLAARAHPTPLQVALVSLLLHPQALLLLAFVAWTITQSSESAKKAEAEYDEDQEEDPLATARRIMKKYK
jgi:hypothetical protein